MFRKAFMMQKQKGANVLGYASVPGMRLRPLPLWDLEAASRVQQKLFPERMPQAPGWEFAGLCRPARMLAGDYYDVFALTPGQVGLALGDVAGKGVGPALVMASLHALIRSRLALYGGDLPRLMHELNQYLFASLPEDMFVTLFLGVLDERTGRLRYVNAGHGHPILVTAQGQEPARLTTASALLGVLPDAAYAEGEVHLPPGSLLALFSDGVTDAVNEWGQSFQVQRLLEVLSSASSLSAVTVLARVLAAVERFVGVSELRDDLAVLVIRRESPG
jgi:sigma-B regulation protein RsbU (phosphoserine phosphatase)